MNKKEALERIDQIISYGHTCFTKDPPNVGITKEINVFWQKIYNLAEIYLGMPNRFCTLLEKEETVKGHYLFVRKYCIEHYMGIAESLKDWIEIQTDDEINESKHNYQNELNNKKIFVVHGRNEAIRRDIFQFLRCLGLEPIEWTEAIKLTGSSSPYIGEVLDAAFSNAQAIVVLLTPDDRVRLRDELQKPDDPNDEKEDRFQARPNVLFEAGMAIARNEKRTILVKIGNVKKFSDIGGRHILYLDNTPEQRQEFMLKLSTAGCSVDTTSKDWLSIGNFI